MGLPEVTENHGELYKILFASTQTKILLVGIQLGIFDELVSEKTSHVIATVLGSDPQNTELLMDGMTAAGLLEKRNGLYRNSKLSQSFLVKDSPTYLGDGFLMQASMKDFDNFGVLRDLVINGPDKNGYHDLGQSPEKWGEMARTLANYQRSGIAQKMAALVSKVPEFESFKTMMDLGGGPGINCIAMVEKHPSMRGVVYDRKPSTDIAKEFIKEYGMQDRISVLPGDYNTDDLGGGYDFIWASYTLNFAQQSLDLVIKKIYDALNPGGVFINLSEGLTNEGTQPKYSVFCTMTWSMQNQPLKAFDQGVIADAMLGAGFRSVRSQTMDNGWGAMDMDIARK